MEPTYRHPDTKELLSQKAMLAEKWHHVQRFRIMGVAPVGMKVTATMLKNAAMWSPGTLVDMKYPLRHISPEVKVQVVPGTVDEQLPWHSVLPSLIVHSTVHNT